MTRVRNDDSGEYETVYDDAMFLDAMGDDESTTADIADTVGCSRQTAYQYLRRLADDDVVTTRKIGNTRLWGVKNDDA